MFANNFVINIHDRLTPSLTKMYCNNIFISWTQVVRPHDEIVSKTKPRKRRSRRDSVFLFIGPRIRITVNVDFSIYRNIFL